MGNTVALILASGSPRRRDIVASLGIPFEVRPSGVSEDVADDLPARQVVALLASRKADAVAKEIGNGLVIGCDTVVALGDKVLGKPSGQEDAVRILRELRGRTHEVLSGVVVRDAASGREEADTIVTQVCMRDYTDEEINEYVKTGEPLDKAGAYAIQGRGRALVSSYEGDLENVIGLPRDTLVRLLRIFVPGVV